MVVGDENAGQGVEVFGFVAVEAEGADVFFEFLQGAAEEAVQGRIGLEEGFGNDIDLAVGGLSAENSGDKELKSVGVTEFAVGFGPEIA